MTQQPRGGSIIVASSLLVIGLATLTPSASVAVRELGDTCTRFCGDALVTDFILNLFLFVPLGFGARLAGIRFRWIVMVGLYLTLAIELLQLRIISGRDASVLDVIANTLGTVVGSWLAEYRSLLVRPDPRLATRLMLAAGSLWLLASLVGGWAILPAPSDAAYYGQLTPDLRQFSPFNGQLLAASVNGARLPSGYLANSDSIRSQLRAARIHLDARIRPDSAPADLAAIVRIADAERREILLLGQYRRDLVFKLRLHATALGLKTPSVAMAKVLPVDSTEFFSVRADVERGRVRLAVSRGATQETRELKLSPSFIWSFFVPWDYWFGPNAGLLTALWIGGLLFPVGYWGATAASSGAGRSRLIAIVASIGLCMVLVPAVYGLPPAPWFHWCAAAASIALGLGAASRIRARSRRHVGERRADDSRGILVG